MFESPFQFYPYSCESELTAAVRPSSVVEGDFVMLTCVSGCATVVHVLWFKDGQSVINVAFSARREDTGRYHCAVWGQERVRSAPVAVNVLCKPFILDT